MAIKYKLHPDYAEFKDELFNIKTIFSQYDDTIHKARNVLKIIPLHSIDTVVKAFRIPNAINQFAYAYIRKSKAYKSYFNAVKLEELDINTPSPIGFIEFYRNGFFKESFFLSKHYPYDFTMADVRDNNPTEKKEILKAFAKFTHELHQKGVWHVDYSGGNILINTTDNGYDFSLVDINRMEFKTVAAYEGLENFNKLWLNEEDLRVLAQSYAELGKLNIQKAIQEILHHDQKLKEHVLRRRKFKAFFKGSK